MYNPTKLKVQLRLAVSRLKMLQNKKASINAQQRREIASLLEKGKEESARIRVEHIIREDYTIEALEMVEIYCEMLLARFGLIEQMKQIDPSLIEAASSIIFSSYRCEVQELGVIKDQLVSKYGKKFGEEAIENKCGVVNERLIQKLKVKIPDPKLVNRYLTEIAKSYNVPWIGDDGDFDLDSSLLGDSSFSQAQSFDDSKRRPSGFGGASNFNGPASFDPPQQYTGRPSISTVSTTSSSMLDELFPSAPSKQNEFRNPLHPDSNQKDDDENNDTDDASAPDFDELTKRFEALKKRQ